jgi:hypothetical protein
VSRHDRLKKLFLEGFRAMDIARPLLSFDAEKDAREVREIMARTDFDLAGVRVAGLVAGFVTAADLEHGSCAENLRPFGDGQVISEDSSLHLALDALDRHEHCFLSTLGTVDAVVGRADVEKPPARMWLFGMITIIEMFVSRTVEAMHPNDAWKELVSAGRLAAACRLRDERRRRTQRVALLDCLQLTDKIQILIRDPEAVLEMGFDSRRAAKDAIKRLESLRNNLAHSQEIVSHDWPIITRLSGRLERILSRA